MKGRRRSGAPIAADLLRLRAARREARAAVVSAERRFEDERTAAFRREIAATIRCVSPFLVALLEAEGRTLDQVAGELLPAPGWPRRPRIHRVVRDWSRDPHALRHASAAAIAGAPYQEAEMLHNSGFPLAAGGWAHVLVVAHSLEVSATIGGTRFQTRLGELRITLRRRARHGGGRAQRSAARRGGRSPAYGGAGLANHPCRGDARLRSHDPVR